MSDRFPPPEPPPTPRYLLAWLDDVVEGAWVDTDGRRVHVRDIREDGSAHLDVVAPDGWDDAELALVRYRIAITRDGGPGGAL